MNAKLWCAVVAACGIGLFVGASLAQDEGEHPEHPEHPGGMQAPEWMQKTEEHAQLLKMAGEWNVDMTWEMPGMPPMKAKSTAKGQMVLDGMYVRQDVSGDMMGQAWQGVLYSGYDTVSEEHVSIWLDSMSPVPTVMRGNKDDKGVLTIEGDGVDHMTGEKEPHAISVEWSGADRYVVTFYEGEGDERQKTGTMVYTRKK